GSVDQLRRCNRSLLLGHDRIVLFLFGGCCLLGSLFGGCRLLLDRCGYFLGRRWRGRRRIGALLLALAQRREFRLQLLLLVVTQRLCFPLRARLIDVGKWHGL